MAFAGTAPLNQHHQLLLDVWREVCRHLEIAESLDRIAPLLTGPLPSCGIAIRQFTLERPGVETVAASSMVEQNPLSILRNECTPQELQRLQKWVVLPEVTLDAASRLRRDLPGLVPDSFSGEVLIGPLNCGHGHQGAVVLGLPDGQQFFPEHVRLLENLLEPFTVALENDRRLHELVSLRERAEAENRSLLLKLGRVDAGEVVVGTQSGLKVVMERVSQVANSDVPVLILGETGSGKEVIARAIHRKSTRQQGPFVRVNCGAIPPELIDSELFGHEKGSFTGASAQRKGWFERADGGTLLLDECGELPLAAQVRLLRVLQDGSFERVGGDRTLHVNVRIVAATHRDLRAMVAEKSFREDLWYRLAIFPVHLPPLRERVSDIPEMARHFAIRAAHKLGLRPCLPDAAQEAQLTEYHWPGNVRELAAVLERAAILGEGRKLDVATALGGNSTPVSPVLSSENSVTGNPAPIRRSELVTVQFPSLDSAMATHIEAALLHAKGRIEGPHGAARMLGINPHTLRARMRKLKIDWQLFRQESV